MGRAKVTGEIIFQKEEERKNIRNQERGNRTTEKAW
jgi:hypothetical protein